MQCKTTLDLSLGVPHIANIDMSPLPPQKKNIKTQSGLTAPLSPRSHPHSFSA